jgi:hypothetical protein
MAALRRSTTRSRTSKRARKSPRRPRRAAKPALALQTWRDGRSAALGIRIMPKVHAAAPPTAHASPAKSPIHTFGPWALGIAGIALVLAMTGLPSRQRPVAGTDVDAPYDEEPALQPEAMTLAAPALAATATSPRRASGTAPAPSVTSAPASAALVGDAPKPAAETESVLPAAAPETSAVERSPVAASTEAASDITITGCLENHDAGFRLKDTAGEEAPRSRSWRTGFLTRRSAALTVVDPTDRMSLQGHVGRRVTLTGKLDGRQMQVHSLRPAGVPCD